MRTTIEELCRFEGGTFVRTSLYVPSNNRRGTITKIEMNERKIIKIYLASPENQLRKGVWQPNEREALQVIDTSWDDPKTTSLTAITFEHCIHPDETIVLEMKAAQAAEEQSEKAA